MRVNGNTASPPLTPLPLPKTGQPFSTFQVFRVLPGPEGLLEDEELSNGAKLLWMLLAWHAGKNFTCWPSEERLAHMLGRSIRQVQRYARELKGAGLVVVAVQNSASNLWTLVYNPRLLGTFDPRSLPQLRSLEVHHPDRNVATGAT